MSFLHQGDGLDSDEEADLKSQMSQILKQAEPPQVLKPLSSEGTVQGCKFIKPFKHDSDKSPETPR